MNDAQRKKIRELRADGYGYGRIAQTLGISENTIKTFCRRNGLGGMVDAPAHVETDGHFCYQCGVPVQQVDGRKEKKFCSDKCRNRWWNSHLDRVDRRANYKHTCQCCQKPFTAYGNRNRKYCTHECYIRARFGGASRV